MYFAWEFCFLCTLVSMYCRTCLTTLKVSIQRTLYKTIKQHNFYRSFIRMLTSVNICKHGLYKNNTLKIYLVLSHENINNIHEIVAFEILHLYKSYLCFVLLDAFHIIPDILQRLKSFPLGLNITTRVLFFKLLPSIYIHVTNLILLLT